MIIDNTIYNYIKNMTFLDIDVIEHMQDLYTYNWKALLYYIKNDLNR